MLKYTEKLLTLFYILFFIEVFMSVYLYFKLPNQIPINFGYFLTTPINFGNKLYVFTLPTATLITVGSWKYFSKSYNKIMDSIFLIINIIMVGLTMYYLVQLF